MAKAYRANIREFLNLPNHYTRAYVIAKVENTTSKTPLKRRGEEKATRPRMDIEFQIGDCSSDVTLEFSDYNGSLEDLDNILYKAEVLYKTCKIFRDAVKKEVSLARKRQKEIDDINNEPE